MSVGNWLESQWRRSLIAGQLQRVRVRLIQHLISRTLQGPQKDLSSGSACKIVVPGDQTPGCATCNNSQEGDIQRRFDLKLEKHLGDKRCVHGVVKFGSVVVETHFSVSWVWIPKCWDRMVPSLVLLGGMPSETFLCDWFWISQFGNAERRHLQISFSLWGIPSNTWVFFLCPPLEDLGSLSAWNRDSSPCWTQHRNPAGLGSFWASLFSS